MQHYGKKIAHIFPTYGIAVFVTIGGFLLFRWLFAIQLPLLNWNIEVWQLWIPLLVPWIPFFIWI